MDRRAHLRVYLYLGVHVVWHALAEGKQRSGWQLGSRERREAGRKAHDGQHDPVPVAVSVADCNPVTGSDGHSIEMVGSLGHGVSRWLGVEVAGPMDGAVWAAFFIVTKGGSRLTCSWHVRGEWSVQHLGPGLEPDPSSPAT
jgi:hypothetical protein